MQQNITPIKANILKYLDLKGISKAKFCSDTGIHPSNLRSSGLRSDFSGNKIAEILTAYPELEPRWLLQGKGDPERLNTPATSIARENQDMYSEKRGVPYYDVDLVSHLDLILKHKITTPDYYIDYPPINNAFCWMNVTGDSMEPLISSGDIVALEQVSNWKDFILAGEIYAIVTQDFSTIKIISNSEDQDFLKLIPYSEEGRYSTQKLPKELVEGVLKIKGILKKVF